MVSDKRGGPQPGAARGPRPPVARPGSVNRGFASVDPERQRETVAEGGKDPDDGHEVPQGRARRARPPGSATPPRRAQAGRGKRGAGEEGGSH